MRTPYAFRLCESFKDPVTGYLSVAENELTPNTHACNPRPVEQLTRWPVPKTEITHGELRIALPNAQIVYAFHSSAVTLTPEEAATVSRSGKQPHNQPDTPKKLPAGFHPPSH